VLRLLVRTIGLLLLAGAFAAAVIDGARSLADQQLRLTPMGVVLARPFPAKFAQLEPFVRTKLHPFLWDPVLLNILYAPAFLDLAVLGLLLILVAQPRRESDGLRPK
jgi:hypothetical protein